MCKLQIKITSYLYGPNNVTCPTTVLRVYNNNQKKNNKPMLIIVMYVRVFSYTHVCHLSINLRNNCPATYKYTKKNVHIEILCLIYIANEKNIEIRALLFRNLLFK